MDSVRALASKGLLRRQLTRGVRATATIHSSCTDICHSTRQQVEAKQATVVGKRGKYVQLKDRHQPAIDFTSRDVFGVQGITGLLKNDVIKSVASRHGFKTPAVDTTATATEHLRNDVSLLHGKDNAMLFSQSVDVTLTHWLRHHLQQQRNGDGGFEAFVHADCSLISSELAQHRYTDIADLEKRLSTSPVTSRKRLVVVEAGSSYRSICQLKALCSTAERYFAMVVLVDPEGLTLIRNAIGDNDEILRVLRRPTVIIGSLSPVTSSTPVSYVTSSRHLVENFRSNNEQLLKTDVDSALAKRIHQRLTLLPCLRRNYYTAMLHGTHLRALLESAGVPVTQHALSISVKLSRDTAQCVLEELLQHGYHVHANADTQQLQTELHFAVDAHHNNDDVTKFARQLISTLRRHNVIDVNRTPKPTPRIVFANLTSMSGNNDTEQQRSLKEVTSYDRLVAVERSQRRKAELHAAHGASVAPRSSRRELLRNSDSLSGGGGRKVLKRNLSSGEAGQFDYDIRILSEVYCWSEDDVAASRDGESWRETVLWASQLPDTSVDDVLEVGQSELGQQQCQQQVSAKSSADDVAVNSTRTSEVRSTAVAANIQYLEELYCHPMFDDEFSHNLAQQL